MTRASLAAAQSEISWKCPDKQASGNVDAGSMMRPSVSAYGQERPIATKKKESLFGRLSDLLRKAKEKRLTKNEPFLFGGSEL